jgi:hypothetical protein
MKLKDYLTLCLELNLKLEPGSSGEYLLNKHIYKKGIRFQFINKTYQNLLMGYDLEDIWLENEYYYYDLFKGKERLMSSLPSEAFEQYIPFVRGKGNILVGGLGLGIIARLYCNKENVQSVTVIEKSPDVITLCGFINKKLKIIEGDFYTYLRENNLSKYNYIYIDTYTTGDEIYPEIIVPTRKYLLEKYPVIPFDFWQEDELKSRHLLNFIHENPLYFPWVPDVTEFLNLPQNNSAVEITTPG